MHDDEGDGIGHTEFLVDAIAEKWSRKRDEGSVWDYREADTLARRLGGYALTVNPESAAVIGALHSLGRPRSQADEAELIAKHQERMEALKLA